MHIRLVIPLALLAAGCNFQKVPKAPIADLPTPAAPDYAQPQNWAAHPDRHDAADFTPNPTLRDNQADAKADVFFLHPTTYFSDKGWNGDLADEKLNRRTDSTAILHQASIFNGSCRVFAPRYRQLVYGGYFVKTPEGFRSAATANEIAYNDARAAFLHYLTHENKGRPFFIAGHSQGTTHAIRLIREFEQEAPLQQHLIAAYLPGWSVKADTFQTLPPCKAADDIRCFVSWCTYEWGHQPDDPAWYRRGIAINPITWSAAPDSSSLGQHQGLVLRNYHKMHSQAIQAKVEGPILWATRPDVQGKWIIRGHNFHIGDYNLFWLDVRNNVAQRLASYLRQGQGAPSHRP